MDEVYIVLAETETEVALWASGHVALRTESYLYDPPICMMDADWLHDASLPFDSVFYEIRDGYQRYGSVRLR